MSFVTEAERHDTNGHKCYHCDGERCSLTLTCAGNEDHCITKTGNRCTASNVSLCYTEGNLSSHTGIISILSVNVGGKIKITKGCASRQMCSATENAQIKAAIGGEMTCCRGDFCNGASITSAGLLLLVTPLVSLLMFS